jgi:hypothetical protein
MLAIYSKKVALVIHPDSVLPKAQRLGSSLIMTDGTRSYLNTTIGGINCQAHLISTVTFTSGSDALTWDLTPFRFGRGIASSASPFFGCGGTPHGRGSFAELRYVRGSAVRKGGNQNKYSR